MELRKHNGGRVPAEITDERGRLLDLITDMHQYFYNKTAALWGDPDQLVSLSELLMSVDILPKYVVTGTPGKKFLKRMGDVLGDRKQDVQVRQGPQADMFLMHQWIKNEPVDLLIGNTYGKYISRDERSRSSGTVFRSSTAWDTSTSPRSATAAPSVCWNRS